MQLHKFNFTWLNLWITGSEIETELRRIMRKIAQHGESIATDLKLPSPVSY